MEPFEKTWPGGYEENWMVYSSSDFSVKELTVLLGRIVMIKATATYGLICMERFGTMNGQDIETSVMIGYNDITTDEICICIETVCERGWRSGI
jgi:hypothetical protein